MSARLSIVSGGLQIQEDAEPGPPLQVVAHFDRITSQDAARGVGRQLGEAIGDSLARRLQTGSARP